VFSLLVSLIKIPFELVKTYQLWPLDMSRNFFWPSIRFELSTPALNSEILACHPDQWFSNIGSMPDVDENDLNLAVDAAHYEAVHDGQRRNG
jgi:hypothetical protein